ncbi:MAG: ribonuclease D [Nitrospirales bacterium]
MTEKHQTAHRSHSSGKRKSDPAAGDSYHYIDTPDALRSLCREWRRVSRLALDTEFVGEDSFVAKLELIQVSAGEMDAVIDVPAVGALDSFAELLADGDILKVVHAGMQDVELLHAHAGQAPIPLFDTQVAAAMVGYGTQVGYANLVQRVLGVKLDKGHTLTNWTQRPLSDEQLQYAMADARYLLPLHDHLVHRLKTLGRLEWVKEEFQRLEARPFDGSRDPRERYRRIRGWDNLRPQAVALLRELTAWREEEARRRNVPRGRIVRDDVLLELARQAPTTLTALRGLRGLHPGEVDRSANALLGHITRALALPSSEWPTVPKSRRAEPEAVGVVELLNAVLKARAEEVKIAPSLLATTGDLQALAEAKQGRDRLDLPLLQGWRRKLAGDLLLSVLDGGCAVSIDPHSGKLRLSRSS